jgi:hypothetical protein
VIIAGTQLNKLKLKLLLMKWFGQAMKSGLNYILCLASLIHQAKSQGKQRNKTMAGYTKI